MARKRMISPEMFTSPTVAALPIASRWTWAGMLCYLDDYGYGDPSPQLIKASVWPRDDSQTSKKVAADIERIIALGSLCCFTCCEREQLHAPAWNEWQNVQHPGKPRFCPCPIHDGGASELHLSLSRSTRDGLNPNVVEVSRDKSSSGDLCSHDSAPGLCPICLRSASALRSVSA